MKAALLIGVGLAMLGCHGEPLPKPAAAAPIALHEAPESPPTRPFPHVIPNSLESGSSPLQCMLEYPLTAEGMQQNQPLIDVLSGNPDAQYFLSYVISCALPEEQAIDVTLNAEEEASFPGLMGVAPEWADGPCDQECQEWVSACLIGRINFYPIHVLFYASGPQEESGLSEPPTDGTSILPMEEGAFFGNYFANPPQLYACRGSGVDPYYRTIRLCTQPGSSCGIQVVGTCGAIDGNTGLASARHVCESFDAEGQFYERCYNVASAEDGTFPPDAHVWTRVMTVHLPYSHFMPDEEQCFEGQ